MLEQPLNSAAQEDGTGSKRLLGHAVQGPDPWPEGGMIPADGDVVLLINGAVMTYPEWEPVVEILSRRYWVVNCDLSGQLLSPGPPRETLEENVEDVIAVLDALRVETVHVVGTSVGAAIGLLLAAAAPERVRTLTLVNGTDRITADLRHRVEDTREALDAALRRGDRERFYEHFLYGTHSDDYRTREVEEIEAHRQRLDLLPTEWFEGLIGILGAFGRADLAPALEKVECPALVVVAREDRVIAAERSRVLAVELGAELVEYPSPAHALVTEEPEWFSGTFAKFVHSWEGERLA